MKTLRLDRVTRINGLDNGVQHASLIDVSVTFPAGRTIGILGTRGSGKSTLVKLLTGAIRPTSGRVIREGRVSPPIGSFGWMNRFMTGRENVRFLADLYGLRPQPIIDFVEEFSGLGASMNQYVGAYSGEKRARIAFAVSYAVPFDIYVADEFLIGGPPGFRDACKAMVRQRQRHSTFILVTRSPSLVRSFCDVAYVLDGGKLTAHDTVQDAVLQHAELMALATAAGDDEVAPTEFNNGFWSEEALDDVG